MSQRDLSRMIGEQFERIAILDRKGINADLRTVPASLSSETPVDRWFGREVLVHESNTIDLSRAADGLPLLWMHDKEKPIGLVENIKLQDGKLRGILRFSNNPKANEIFNDVREGFLKNISIGYSVDKFEETSGIDTVRVTGWTLLETSVVTVPADSTVGINRSYQAGDKSMTDEKKPVESGMQETDAAPVVDISKMRRDHQIAKKAGAAEAIKGERERIAGVHEIFDLALVPRNDFYAGLRARAIDEGWAVEGTRKILMDVLSGEAEPAIDYAAAADPVIRVATHEGRLPPVVIPSKPSNQHRGLGGTVSMGEDETDKFRTGLTEALLVKSGVVNDRKAIDSARAGGFIGKRMVSIAGDYCRLMGISTTSLSDDDIAGRALSYRSASGQTTSDFTNILANVANKSLLKGWEEAPETWQQWTRRGNLPDFKTAEISGLSGFTGLDEVPEDGDITYGKFTDRKETIKLVQYAKKYRITRKLIINDDLQALSAIPRAMGRAGSRKVGDVTYALLNGVGPTLNQDSLALFHANHNNYTLAATAPTVATLNTASSAMKKQTDPNTSATLNIQARFLMAPVALENTSRVLIAATYDPAGTAGTLPPNPFSGRYEVITDARLDGQTNGTTAWYLMADPNLFDTIEVAFLDGMAEPYMRENQEWDGQGTSYLVGIDFGVSALDFRGIHKYRGS